MPGLSVYKIEQAEQWDDIVRSFQDYDVYYLSGYAKTFQLHGDGEPLLFFYNGEGIRAINVVMKRDIADAVCFKSVLPKGRYFDFATPYGYGGWLIEGTGNTAPLFLAYADWCTENKIVSEFARFHPIMENQNMTGTFYDVVPLGKTIAIKLISPQSIWENLTTQNRGRIRKAKQNGIQVYHGRSPELYRTFEEIYISTMEKDQASGYYYFQRSFYESILNDLPQHAQVFYAQADNIVLASYIVLAANGLLHYHLGGSRQEYLKLAPNNVLMYEIALWGCANGCKILHLGGGVGGKEDSLLRFKKSFSRGEPLQYYIGKKIFQPSIYQELLIARQELPDTEFFPRYRA